MLAADPTSQATQATIEAFNAAFNSHDIGAIMELMTGDCVFENTFPAPDGTRVVGHDALRQVWQELFSASPQAHFATEELFVAGDRGVVRWRYTWGTPPHTGHVRGVDILRVRDGRIAEKFSYVKG